MGELTDYKVTRSKRRSIALVVHPDGSLEVRAPRYIPIFAIKLFVKNQTDWIKKRQAQVSVIKFIPKKFVNGQRFSYLGVEYLLELGNYTQIEIKGDKLLFPIALKARGKETLEKWYIKQAKKIISEQVEHFSKEMDTSYKSITFSDTRSKWGSCTHDNRLQFNWRLIMAPFLVLRYVVIHELAHTEEKNHSRAFWQKVRSINPSYKQQIKWLKSQGNSLRI